jgi:hypothetical protein
LLTHTTIGYRGFSDDITASPTLEAPACPLPDPDGLFKKLTGIRVLGQQVISDADARGVSDELIATVRCNAFEAAQDGARQATRKIVIPAVTLAAVAAASAIAAALFISRRTPRSTPAQRRKRVPRTA